MNRFAEGPLIAGCVLRTTRIGCNAVGVGNLADGEAGSFAVEFRGGLALVLEPTGSWDGVEGWAWWFEYEYRPSG